MRRPRTPYSESLAREICRRTREGQGLYAICREPGMPHYTALHQWTKRHPAFAADLARARALYAVTEGFGRRYSTEIADAHMPPVGTLFCWIERHREFAAKYGRARALSAEAGLARIAYSQATADEFCAASAAGALLRKVCERPGMPQPATIHLWLSRRPDFAARYEQARELRRLGADPTMPSHGAVLAWRRDRPEVKAAYARACEEAAAMVEDHMRYVVNTVTRETATADRVKLAGLTTMANRHDRAAARARPADAWGPLTVRFVDPDGTEWDETL